MGWPYQQKPLMGWPLDYDSGLADFVGYWPLNEDGGKTIADLSGNGFTLTHNGDWVAEGIKLNGSSDEITSPTFLDDFPSSGFTVQVAFVPTSNITSGGSHTYLMKKQNISGQDRLYWYFSLIDGSLSVGTEAANGGYSELDSTLTTHLAGVEYIYTFVWSTTRGKELYLNGILDVSDATKNVLMLDGTNEDFFIGSAGGGSYGNITVKHITVYPRTLTSAEIQKLSMNPYCMFKDPAEVALLGGYQAVVSGMSGAMTTNAGYWGW